MKRGLTLVSCLALLTLAAAGRAQDAQIPGAEAGDQYRVLAAMRTATLQDELAQAATAGYRVVQGWFSGAESVLFLEKSLQPPSEYLVVAAADTATFQKEVNEAAVKGFRMVASTVTIHPSPLPVPRTEILAVMEKAPGATYRYDYAVVAVATEYQYVPGSSAALVGGMEKTPLQDAIYRIADEGYSVIALVTRTEESKRERLLGKFSAGVSTVVHIAIGERQVDKPPSPAPRDRFYLVVGKPSPEVQQQLDEAGAKGYRLLVVAPSAFPEMVAVMEKASEPSISYQYLLVSAADLMTLKNKLQIAGSRGFRPHPAAVFTDPPAVVTEKAPNSQRQLDFRLRQLKRNSAFHKELIAAMGDGYELAGASPNLDLVVFRKTLEKVAEAPAAPAVVSPRASGSPMRKSIGGMKTRALEQQLNEAGAEGFRVTAASAFGDEPFGSEVSFTLEKSVDSPDKYNYLLVAATKTSTLEKELNEGGAKGFCIVPGTVVRKATMLRGYEVMAAMEKAPGAQSSYKYLVVAARRESTFEKELESARQQGYSLVETVRRDENIAILEKPATEP